MFKRYATVALALLLLVGLLVIPMSAAEKKVIVGISIRTNRHPVHIIYGETVKKLAEADGYEAIYTSANEDAAKQVNDIEDMLAMGANAFVIVPQHESQIVPTLVKINQKGFPLVILDTPAKGGMQIFVGCSPRRSGQLSAEYAIKKIGGKGKVIIIAGVPGNVYAMNFTSGYYDILKKYPNIKVVAEQSADWRTDKAMKVVEDLLLVHRDVDAILCNNDMMAVGAVEALKGAGFKPGQVIVTGGDGDKGALELIKQGWLTCTIDKFPETEAKTAYDCLVKLIKGEYFPCEYGPTGARILTEGLVIDKANVASRPGY